MPFSWDKRYVLRRVNETDPNVHRIYWHGESSEAITDATSVIDWEPVFASKSLFIALAINPPEPWLVTFPSGSELLGVFKLEKR